MESKEFKAKRDSQVQVKLDPSISALSEVVVVGYGTKKAESEKEDVSTGYAPPSPVNGKSNFDKYIKENQHRPDTITAGQRAVVVVSFLVRINGNIDSIRIVRSPGKIFSDEAIRLIKSGPPWKSAEDNGKPIEDKVRIRIVFR
jgi:TonB family protein